MYKPEMYVNPDGYRSEIPNAAAIMCLERFFSVESRRRLACGRVLDVGCGDGAVTQTLRSYLGAGAQLSACDLEPALVTHARHLHGHAGVRFFTMDATQKPPVNERSAYDFVFSNFTLHWIRDHGKVLSCLHEVLNEGGECLLIFLPRCPLWSALRILAKDPKWLHYMEDVEEFVTVYQDTEHPEDIFSELMKEKGFISVDVQCVPFDVISHYDRLRSTMRSINPFIQRIPADKQDMYMDEYMDSLLRLFGHVMEDSARNRTEELLCPSTLIVATGTKKAIPVAKS